MLRQILQNIILLVAFCVIVCSCKKDKPGDTNHTLPKDTTGRVLVVCEGSLGNGNAALGVYLPGIDSSYNDVFQSANKQALGDVFQSLAKLNGQYFLCVNNSDKIVVLDPVNWLQKASIPVSKPRYILSISDQKAYVGSLFSNKVFVINPKTFSVEKQIEMPFQNTEGMLLKDGIAYVCCWDTACNKLYQIDVNTDRIADSITLSGRAPQSVLQDKEGKLWVLGGNAYKNTSTNLNRIDATTKKVLQSFLFADGVEAIKPCFNASLDSLYFIEVNYSGGPVNNGIYRMPISSPTLPKTAFVTCLANQYFWALGIDPHTNEIYIGDPKGFVQKSTVLRYDPKGTLLHQFNTGLGVGAFYFD